MGIVIVCSLVAIGALGFTLLVREKDIPPAPFENPELKHLENRRQVLYDNLKDLQFEFHQGKLSEEDYQSLKAGFLYDLAGLMNAIEREQANPSRPSGPDGPSGPRGNRQGAARVPNQSRDRKGAVHLPVQPGTGPDSKSVGEPDAKSKSKTKHTATAEIPCPSCGASNAPSNRFCGQCGTTLQK